MRTNVTTFNFGIGTPDDADLVVTNQNLFFANRVVGDPSSSSVLKIAKTGFNGFVDDVVIMEETQGSVVIVHWDDVKFVLRRLTLSAGDVSEHAAFAPIEAQP